ncbi:MAG TPA: DUF4920 domain-containing protein [Bacteroidia bacterium]|nr:DUF4920 domain-containing protein [Bacteroidia bacterium]
MKKYVAFAFFLCIIGYVQAQAPKGKAKPGTNYGETINELNAMPGQELPQMLSHQDTVEVKVSTKVFNSCASEGCWLTFKANDSTTVMVKTRNHNFFVPLDIRGKNVIIDCKAYNKTVSVADQKHYAKDAGKPKKEIDAITKDQKQIICIARGILVVN